jgi:hypothetical protein
MRPRLVFGLVLLPLLVLPASAEPAGAANGCRFVLGFRAIHDMIPQTAGNCLVNECHGDNGDALQETIAWHGKGGLLVWRKADNWKAFTDGGTTWVNGPHGLQKRPNGQRFAWEGDAASYPIVSGTVGLPDPLAPTPTPAAIGFGLRR